MRKQDGEGKTGNKQLINGQVTTVGNSTPRSGDFWVTGQYSHNLRVMPRVGQGSWATDPLNPICPRLRADCGASLMALHKDQARSCIQRKPSSRAFHLCAVETPTVCAGSASTGGPWKGEC